MTGAAPRLRRLAPADAAAYRALMLEAYASSPMLYTSTAEERGALPLAWWEERTGEGPDAHELVTGAFRGDALVGAVALARGRRERTRHKLRLRGLFVRAEERGRGLGEALVREALRVAAELPDIALVQLSVTDTNHGALRLYERLGFERAGAEPLAVRTPAGFVTKVHMWRRAPRDGG